jgi:hypothetical protein
LTGKPSRSSISKRPPGKGGDPVAYALTLHLHPRARRHPLFPLSPRRAIIPRMSEKNEATSIIDNASKVVVGKKRALELMTVALLAGGHVLLEDEINRTIPRTQASLLESMGEFQVTVDANTIDLPRPFFVVATQNPKVRYGASPRDSLGLIKCAQDYPQARGTGEGRHRSDRQRRQRIEWNIGQPALFPVWRK